MQNKYLIIALIVLVAIFGAGFFAFAYCGAHQGLSWNYGGFTPMHGIMGGMMGVYYSGGDDSGGVSSYLSARDDLRHEMMMQGDYACCLQNPCTYCLLKTPSHGEGASCHCLDDVINGKHPCGECIGEILEGHGNKFFSEYFARAIAEEVGEEHLPELEKIISEKYAQ